MAARAPAKSWTAKYGTIFRKRKSDGLTRAKLKETAGLRWAPDWAAVRYTLNANARPHTQATGKNDVDDVMMLLLLLEDDEAAEAEFMTYSPTHCAAPPICTNKHVPKASARSMVLRGLGKGPSSASAAAMALDVRLPTLNDLAIVSAVPEEVVVVVGSNGCCSGLCDISDQVLHFNKTRRRSKAKEEERGVISAREARGERLRMSMMMVTP
jgi:hypothetical protein